jgi:hypothetical protein
MDNRHSGARRPFLMNFIRPKPVSDIEYLYDRNRQLNVEKRSGIAVIAIAGGKAMTKTQAADSEE